MRGMSVHKPNFMEIHEHFIKNHKCELHDGSRGKFRGSPTVSRTHSLGIMDALQTVLHVLNF